MGQYRASRVCSAESRRRGPRLIEKANANAKKLHAAWEEVLERHGVAGYVYGPCSTFHVYFESDEQRIREASGREDLHTSDTNRLKGMSGALIRQYQFHMRLHGVDNMSSTGGVLSAAHTNKDIEDATAAFEKTVLALLDQGMIHGL